MGRRWGGKGRRWGGKGEGEEGEEGEEEEEEEEEEVTGGVNVCMGGGGRELGTNVYAKRGVTNHWTEVEWTGLDWTHKNVTNKLINHRKQN